MYLELIDKMNDNIYSEYSKFFRKCFDIKYMLGPNVINPFRSKDNRYYFLKHSKDSEILGICNILFLKESTFNALLKGELVDDMLLTLEDISYITESDILYSYISSIAISEKYTNHGLGTQLLNLVLEDIKTVYSNKSIEVLSLCINESSEKVHRKVGFELKLLNSNNEPIYYKSLS